MQPLIHTRLHGRPVALALLNEGLMHAQKIFFIHFQLHPHRNPRSRTPQTSP